MTAAVADTSSAANLYATLKKIVELIDADNSGQIDLAEFRPVYMRLNPLGSDEDAKRVFSSIDADGSGEISINELAAHYGLKVGSKGVVVGDLDTSGMSDDQLIELMHLNSIASDTHTEAVRKVRARAKPLPLARAPRVRRAAPALTFLLAACFHARAPLRPPAGEGGGGGGGQAASAED